MNIAKNIEAILVATLAVISLTGVATAAARTGHHSAVPPLTAMASSLTTMATIMTTTNTMATSMTPDTDAPGALQELPAQAGAMTVVTVSAKRLSAAEKAAL